MEWRRMGITEGMIMVFTKNMQVGAVSGGLFATGVLSALVVHALLWTNTPVTTLTLTIICVISFSGAGAQWRVHRND
jgi:hypothetical protein